MMGLNMETDITKPYNIVVVDQYGNNDNLEVYSTYTIDQLKTIISVKRSIGSHLLRLIYNGEALEDSKKMLFDYKIQKNCRLFLTFGIK
jgi:hypothetical protein